MNQLDLLSLLINEIELVVGVGVPVHTGTDEDRDLPHVTLSTWSGERTDDGGNLNFAGYTTDVNGNITGVKYHTYHDAMVRVSVQSADEVESHNLLTAIEEHFNLYEDDPATLHAEIRSVEVANGGDDDVQFAPPVPTFGQRLQLQLKFYNLLTKTAAELGEDVLQNITETTYYK